MIMYNVTLHHTGRPAERRKCATGGELRNAVWDLIRSEGGAISDSDTGELIRLVGHARSIADIDGFAALTFDTGAVTIRPVQEGE